jgi:replicative DNA helicase
MASITYTYEDAAGSLAAAADELVAIAAARAAARRDGRPSTGLVTPWPTLTQWTDGWWPGQLSIVAGPPSGGKTSWAANAAAAALDEAAWVLYLSLEMRPSTILGRILGALRRQPLPEDPDAVRQLTGDFIDAFGARLRIWAPAAAADMRPDAVDDLCAALDADLGAEATFTRGLVVVDYLQLLARHWHPDGADLRIAVGDTAVRLRRLAGQRQAHVLALSSISRAGGYDLDRLGLDALKESGEIEYSADLVLLLGLDDPYRQLLRLRTLKNRNNGTRVGRELRLRIDPASGWIAEVAIRRDDAEAEATAAWAWADADAETADAPWLPELPDGEEARP